MIRVGITVMMMGLLMACPKKREEQQPAPKPEMAKSEEAPTAECEFIGTWSDVDGGTASATFVLQAEPCLPYQERPTTLGREKVSTPGKLFAEFFVPQGTKAHMCLYGADAAGQVIALADSPRNPVTLKGDGEVMVTDLSFLLQRLP